MSIDPMRLAFEKLADQHGYTEDESTEDCGNRSMFIHGLEIGYQAALSQTDVSKETQLNSTIVDSACQPRMSEELAVKFEEMHRNGDVWITSIAAAKLARDLLAKLPAQEWQPIETAPKDGTYIILYQPDFKDENTVRQARKPREMRISTGFFDYYEKRGWFEFQSGDGYEYQENQIFPTHWMPLPNPPINGGQ